MVCVPSNQFSPARRFLAALTVAVFLSACTKWSARPLTPDAFPSTGSGRQAARRVRVTLVSGAQVVATDPWIANDSLVWVSQDSTTGTPIGRRGVPVSSVAKVEVRQFDTYGTALLVAGVGITVAIVKLAGSGSSPGVVNGGGSCPVVYSWDGQDWHLESGTFGGAILEPLARTDVSNLDFVHPAQGEVRLRVADILSETDHLDAVTLLAVDHDSDVTVAPDGTGSLHTLGPLVPPVVARDDRGRDVLPQVRVADGWNWESVPALRDTLDPQALRDGIELEFVRPPHAGTARLVLDGTNTPWAAAMVQRLLAAHGAETRAWSDSMDAAPAVARALAKKLSSEAFLTASVRDGDRWAAQGVFWEAGPEIEKRQVLPIDLSRVLGDTIHVRLESVPSFWLIDQVALDFTTERPVTVTALAPAQAVTSTGRDVRVELASTDHRYFTMEKGDGAELTYRVPEVPPSRSRTYLVQSTGWYRLHTQDGGPPDTAMIATLATARLGLARMSVGAMNVALRDMATPDR